MVTEQETNIVHGTHSAYVRGQCRCDICLTFIRAYRKDYTRKKKIEFAVTPEAFEHGKISTYMLGCRCDDCKAAKSTYSKTHPNKKKCTCGDCTVHRTEVSTNETVDSPAQGSE
jgi:DNA gyrase inhibitor GyrI